MVDLEAPIIPNGSFKWKEFLYLPSWGKYADPTLPQQANAIILFQKIEPLRLELGKPMVITDGLRTVEYMQYLQRHNIPAAEHSAHNEGQAIDFYVDGMTYTEYWGWFNERWLGRLENMTPEQVHCHIDDWNWGDKIRFTA